MSNHIYRIINRSSHMHTHTENKTIGYKWVWSVLIYICIGKQKFFIHSFIHSKFSPLQKLNTIDFDYKLLVTIGIVPYIEARARSPYTSLLSYPDLNTLHSNTICTHRVLMNSANCVYEEK